MFSLNVKHPLDVDTKEGHRIFLRHATHKGGRELMEALKAEGYDAIVHDPKVAEGMEGKQEIRASGNGSGARWGTEAIVDRPRG